MKRIEDSLRDLWDTSKHTNIRNTGVPEEEEKKKKNEEIFEEIIVEKFTKTGREIVNSRKCRESHEDKSKEKHAKTHIKQPIKN